MSISLTGEIRSDRYGLLWVFGDNRWIPIIDQNTGEQTSLAEYEGVYDPPQFSEEDDPSGDDPRLISRLTRIEYKLDLLLGK